MTKKLLILVDYRNQFWLKSNYKEENFDLERLKNNFIGYGYDVFIKNFSNVNLKVDNFSNTYVIYQSSEDPELYYKSYIEDILWGIKLKGGILIPDLMHLRAHHNKVFMEVLRDVSESPSLKTLDSEYFGTYQDFESERNKLAGTPKVLKSSDGAQSKNVLLLKTESDFKNKPRQLSKTFNFYYWLVDKIKPFLPKKYPNYNIKSHHRKKFILQEFVEDLSGDYKLLVYNTKVFVLQRSVREGDFRASGSGNFQYVETLPKGLLDYAIRCYKAFDVPFMGLDVASKNDQFYLIEFQFVSFGNYTLERSPFYFEKQNDSWNVIHTASDLENEFALAIHAFIEKGNKNSI